MSASFLYILCLYSNYFFRIVDLQVEPSNIAIPTSLITLEDAQLIFTVYVQIRDVFLVRDDLQKVLQVKKVYWEIFEASNLCRFRSYNILAN